MTEVVAQLVGAVASVLTTLAVAWIKAYLERRRAAAAAATEQRSVAD